VKRDRNHPLVTPLTHPPGIVEARANGQPIPAWSVDLATGATEIHVAMRVPEGVIQREGHPEATRWVKGGKVADARTGRLVDAEVGLAAGPVADEILVLRKARLKLPRVLPARCRVVGAFREAES
jgi:hypothetical protein